MSTDRWSPAPGPGVVKDVPDSSDSGDGPAASGPGVPPAVMPGAGVLSGFGRRRRAHRRPPGAGTGASSELETAERVSFEDPNWTVNGKGFAVQKGNHEGGRPSHWSKPAAEPLGYRRAWCATSDDELSALRD